MNREELEKALEVFDKRYEAQTFGNWSQSYPFLAEAARERLAQLPEYCGTCGGSVWRERCTTCHGSGKVYPAELVERMLHGAIQAVQNADNGMIPTEEVLKALHVAMPAVLDALNGETE